jgi:hypothetical protein
MSQAKNTGIARKLLNGMGEGKEPAVIASLFARSEPGVAGHGRRMGQRDGAMALSGRRGDHVDRRSGHAFASCPRMEKGQYVSLTCKLHC